MLKVLRICGVALALALGASLVVAGGAAPTYTVIQVEKMHCDGCASRIGGKLQETPGVKNIQFDVEKKLLWVHPQPGAKLSPKVLWEAVEKANDRPTKLQGPSGVFLTKPKS